VFSEALSQIIGRLDQAQKSHLLHSYVLIGGFAVSAWGVARATQDIALAVALGTSEPQALGLCPDDCSWLSHDGLFRFVQMFLQVGHEGGAAGAHRRGIAHTGLMLAIDVTVCVADVDFPELGQ
jgi:hypothetical protein